MTLVSLVVEANLKHLLAGPRVDRPAFIQAENAQLNRTANWGVSLGSSALKAKREERASNETEKQSSYLDG
jgi:hypothetical protein